MGSPLTTDPTAISARPIPVPRRRRDRVGIGGTGSAVPALVVVVATCLVPVGLFLFRGFGGGLDHYNQVFGDPLFWSALRFTVEVAAATTAVCLLIGFPFAYVLVTMSRKAAGRILVLVVLSMLMSVLVRTYAWQVILGRQGILNSLLADARLIDEPLSMLYTPFAVITGMVHYLLPYMVLVLYSGFRNIDLGLMRAARTLGASRLRSFTTVFIPLAMPAIIAASTLVFVISLGFFVVPDLLGAPGDQTLSMYIERSIRRLDWGAASATASFLLVAAVVLYGWIGRVVGIDAVLAPERS